LTVLIDGKKKNVRQGCEHMSKQT